MKRSILAAIAALLLIPLVGCGGGHGGVGGAATRTGSTIMKIVWPDKPSGRFIPENVNTIKLEFFLPSDFDSSGNQKPGHNPLQIKWLDRPYLPATATLPERTQQYTATSLPVGQILIHATGYRGRVGANFTAVPPTFVAGSDVNPNTRQGDESGNATGDAPIAGTKKLTADVLITIKPKEQQTTPEPFVITMQSNISTIKVYATSINQSLSLKTGDGYLLVASPRDANDAIVLVNSNNLKWSLGSGSGITLKGNTGTAIPVTADADNSTTTPNTIHIVETDSGKSVDVPFSVSLSGYGGFDGVGIPGAGQDITTGTIVGDGPDIYLSGLDGGGMPTGQLNRTTKDNPNPNSPLASRFQQLASVHAIRSGVVYEYDSFAKTITATDGETLSRSSIFVDLNSVDFVPRSISVGTDGTVYVFGSNQFSTIYGLRKYDSTGTLIGGFVPVPNQDSGGAILTDFGPATTDDAGNLYFVINASSFSAWQVRKMAPDGTVGTSYNISVPFNSQIQAGGGGFLYVLSTSGISGGLKLNVRVYNQTGAEETTLAQTDVTVVNLNYQYLSTSGSYFTTTGKFPIELAGFDAHGNVYVALGKDQDPPSDAVYDENGNPVGAALWGYSVLAR